jgi:signal transduction histidine kinase
MAGASKFGTATATGRIRWRESLLVRVVALCAVLLLCLLGSAVGIMRFYVHRAAEDMRALSETMAEHARLAIERDPGIDAAGLERELRTINQALEITIREGDWDDPAPVIQTERRAEGSITRISEVPLDYAGHRLVLTLRNTTAAQVELLRAFTDRYVLALTIVFVLTLALMVYFIAKALRPLNDLSRSCAAIGHGELRPVQSRGATGEILALENTFNEMVKSLREKEVMETHLRQAQRLSALGNLAAGIAHDVRNPLNAIKLLSSHALDGLRGAEDAPAAKPLETIRDEVKRLEEIVSNFLSLAKERELVLELHAVDPLLEECLRLFQRDAEARGVRLSAELRAGDTALMLDPKQWTRAVLNVLLNALEACPAGGRVRMFSRVTDRTCEVEIRDDGPGLDREAADRVFEPYYTTKPGGTGLGLSVTRGIVEEHGGRIVLSGAPGEGCQVLITLPLDATRTP